VQIVPAPQSYKKQNITLTPANNKTGSLPTTLEKAIENSDRKASTDEIKVAVLKEELFVEVSNLGVRKKADSYTCFILLKGQYICWIELMAEVDKNENQKSFTVNKLNLKLADDKIYPYQLELTCKHNKKITIHIIKFKLVDNRIQFDRKRRQVAPKTHQKNELNYARNSAKYIVYGVIDTTKTPLPPTNQAITTALANTQDDPPPPTKKRSLVQENIAIYEKQAEELAKSDENQRAFQVQKQGKANDDSEKKPVVRLTSR